VVWVRHTDPQLSWVNARFKSESDSGLVFLTDDGQEFSVPKSEQKSVLIASHSSINSVVDNLVSLEEFNAGAILHQLRKRYNQDAIYTWIGSILVSINPFKALPIYTSTVLQEFMALQDLTKASPHVYALAAAAYRDMSLDREAQAFVISGEVRFSVNQTHCA